MLGGAFLAGLFGSDLTLLQEHPMNNIIYIVGLVVVIIAVLSLDTATSEIAAATTGWIIRSSELKRTWPPDSSRSRPGGICLSYETYALVRDLVRARPLAPIQMKGISREVVPYVVEGLLGELAQRAHVIAENARGLDLLVDLDALRPTD
jgi:hypothetical protein